VKLMRSLIVAKVSPIPPPDGMHGALRRQNLFLSAIRSLSREIEFVWFARRDLIEALGPLAPHEAALSSEWGLPVCLSPIPERGQRRKTLWTVYGAGALSAWEQADYYHFTGPDQVARLAESLARRPDLVFASQLPPMGALMRTGAKPARLFFDLSDVEHRKLVRTNRELPNRPGKLLHASHILPLLLAERRAIRMADASFVCSEEDRRYLRRIGLGRGVAVVPNGLPVPPHPAPPCPDPTILLLGTYGYEPNSVAAQRLVTRIFPLVRQQVPEARLTVAGGFPERIASFRSAPPGVEFTGFVPDLDKLYADSRVVACPVSVGSGTRLKLVEAAAYGRPMVSTRIGAEGLAFEDGREIMLRDDDEGFAAACVTLLRDDAACARLGAAARARMKASYAAEGIVDQIAGIMGGGGQLRPAFNDVAGKG
jgi:glycosyltransferase involved in cell wall biosynthesis